VSFGLSGTGAGRKQMNKCTACPLSFSKRNLLARHYNSFHSIYNNISQQAGGAAYPVLSAAPPCVPHEAPALQRAVSSESVVGLADENDIYVANDTTAPVIGPPAPTAPLPPDTGHWRSAEAAAVLEKFKHLFAGCITPGDFDAPLPDPILPDPPLSPSPSFFDHPILRQLRLVISSGRSLDEKVAKTLSLLRSYPTDALPEQAAIEKVIRGPARSSFATVKIMAEPDVYGAVKNCAMTIGKWLAKDWANVRSRLVRFQDLRPFPFAPDGSRIFDPDLRTTKRMHDILKLAHEDHPGAVVVPLVIYIDDTLGRNGNWGADLFTDVLVSPVCQPLPGGKRDLREFKMRIGILEDTNSHPVGGATKEEAKLIRSEARQRVYDIFLRSIAQTHKVPMSVDVGDGELIKVIVVPYLFALDHKEGFSFCRLKDKSCRFCDGLDKDGAGK
jgi:hypothetical protein